MAKRKNKGLGVGALLSQINTSIESDKQELVSQLSNTITEIPLEQIEANPNNPRVEFDEEALAQLASSIKMHGLIQPITVRHLGEQQFQLISGERRLRASKLAGLQVVPAYVRVADDDAILELALIENIQRQDLNALEIATTYDRLMEELKLTHDTLAKRVGKKRSTVTNYLRLLKLPANIQSSITSEEISMGHARSLVNIEDASLQNFMCQEVVNKGLSVRQLEAYVKMLTKAMPKIVDAIKDKQISLKHAEIISQLPDMSAQLSVYKDVVKYNLDEAATEKLVSQHLQRFDDEVHKKPAPTKTTLALPYQRVQDNLKSQLSTKVQLKVDKKGKGQIVINFMDDDDLNRILDLLEEN